MQLELQEKGLQWSNLISPAIQDDNLTPLAIFVILAFDTLLYLVLTWYIEGVWPGRYGVAKPFYFPFMPSYWLGQRGRGVCPSRRTARHMTLQENDDSELKRELVITPKISITFVSVHFLPTLRLAL